MARLTIGIRHTYKIRGLQSRKQKVILMYQFVTRQVLYCPPRSHLLSQTSLPPHMQSKCMNRYIQIHIVYTVHNRGAF